MGIEIEERSKLIYLIPGVYQEDLKTLFHQVIFGLTDEGVVVYNDQLPDASSAGSYVYKIHAKLQYSDIMLVRIEDLKGKKDLIYQKKILFVADDQNNSLALYVKKEDYKYIKGLEKHLRSRKIDIKHRKTKVEL